MYSTYEAPFAGAPADESAPSDAKKVIILGGGPNRIGQGIEFDYCCCHACFALHDAGYETIMVNCNPETVSTDYDTADRLYFEPLTAEDVLEIIATERTNGTLHGVIVQFGGQTPLKLAARAGGGQRADPRHLARRHRPRRGPRPLQARARQARLKQPKNGIAYSVEQARLVAADLGLPLVVRPSYVLGGRAMQIIREETQLGDYLLGTLPELVPGDVKARYPNDKTGQINTVLGTNPLLFDRYLSDAIEVDVDCLCDGKDTFIVGIMEHIEEAGIHSGDSACSLPPHSLDAEMIGELERQTRELALGLDVVGLMNVQYAIKDGDIYVLEVNPRASRTVPFVAKVIGMPVAKIAARVMAGEKLADFNLKKRKLGHVGVKESVFPFARFPGVDTVLGPEMRSTGEVMGIDRSFAIAFAKSQLGGGTRVPRKGTVFVSVRESDKTRIVDAVRLLHSLGFKVHRDLRHPALPRPTAAFRPKRSTRCWKDGRISSTPSRTATSSWSSTPPRGRRRWPTAGRCGGLPSCIKCHITPLFRVPWRPRRASRPIWTGTLRSARCRVTFPKPDPLTGRSRPRSGSAVNPA